MSPTSRLRSLSAIAVLSLLLSSRATAGPALPHYTVTDLGTLGGPDSVGNGINDRGEVVGNSTLPNGTRHAFHWSAGSMMDLGALGGGQSDAFRINNNGTAAGQAKSRTGEWQAAIWPRWRFQPLGITGGALDINDAGWVAGYDNGKPTIWTDTAAVNGVLGRQADNGDSSYWTPSGTAWSINNSGWWAGEAGRSAWWTGKGPMLVPSGSSAGPTFESGVDRLGLWGLGGRTPNGGPTTSAVPTGMNEKGENVGYLDSAPGNLASLWTGDTDQATQTLGTLGGVESRAWDINDASQIVGEAEIATGAWHAFLYTAAGGMLDLNARIDPNLGWVLQKARGINAAGQIAGTGTINGQTHAFLLTPLPSAGTGAWVTTDGAVQFFSGVLDNGAATQRSFQVRNSGDAPLTISDVKVAGADPGDFAASGGTGVTLPPGGSTPVTVTFKPTAAGIRAGFLAITSNGYYSPTTVTLLGNGIGANPTLQVDTTSFAFGSVPLTTTSVARSLQVTNRGDAPLTLSGVSVAGANAGDFTVTGDTGTSLLPSQSTTLTITFAPGALGSRSASLGIASNAVNSPPSISLTGTGIAATRWVQVAKSLDFGSVGLNTTSPWQTLTINNIGNAPFTISSVRLTGANAGDFAVSDRSAGVTVPPNGATPLTVRYSPSAVGSRGATVVITSSADNSPTPVLLTGTSVAPPSAPTGLKVIGFSDNKVTLGWTDNSSNETAFAIWRQTGSGAFERVGVVPPNHPSFIDAGVAPQTAYTYEVRATNDIYASTWSNQVTVTTAPAPPAAPTGLRVINAAADKVALRWSDNSSNEAAFEIWRKTAGGSYVFLSYMPANSTGFTDLRVSPSTSYTYTIRAIKPPLASSFTQGVTVTTPAALK